MISNCRGNMQEGENLEKKMGRSGKKGSTGVGTQTYQIPCCYNRVPGLVAVWLVKHLVVLACWHHIESTRASAIFVHPCCCCIKAPSILCKVVGVWKGIQTQKPCYNRHGTWPDPITPSNSGQHRYQMLNYYDDNDIQASLKALYFFL